MFHHSADDRPSVSVPKPRRLVVTARHHTCPIRAECHAQDRTIMFHHSADGSPRLSIPKSCRFVATRRHNARPVGAERHVEDTIIMDERGYHQGRVAGQSIEENAPIRVTQRAVLWNCFRCH